MMIIDPLSLNGNERLTQWEAQKKDSDFQLYRVGAARSLPTHIDFVYFRVMKHQNNNDRNVTFQDAIIYFTNAS